MGQYDQFESPPALEYFNVICTGGTYDDPELGQRPRHERVKVARLRVFTSKSADGSQWNYRMHPWGESRTEVKCRLCGRSAPVGSSWTNDGKVMGGIWQEMLDWVLQNHPDRRVYVVNLGDLLT